MSFVHMGNGSSDRAGLEAWLGVLITSVSGLFVVVVASTEVFLLIIFPRFRWPCRRAFASYKLL